jgi:bla regulator protein BlaR1
MINTYPTFIVHLWQSTLVAAVAGLLTLLLKQNQARTRYWVWLAALVKFLIPFGVLVSLGGHLGPPGWTPKVPAIMEPTISFVMGDVGQSTLTTPLAASQATNDRLPALLFGVWACGFLVILSRWLLRWMQVRADVRAGSRLSIEIGIPVVSSPVLREPGVFGILRPVLLLPEGIAEHLSKAEWESVLAHELCHARCYDNLTAAIYMLVETIFWFHPLVWWMGKRLVAERERACDEEVLRLGSDPKVYAEGILKVCELYLESPLECVAGVTGSNLRRRIRAIMTYQGTERMKMGKKLLLLVAGILAVAGPLVVGILNTPSARAQSQQAPPTAAVIPKFEVASIKPNTSGAAGAGFQPFPSGRLSVVNNALRNVILNAYDIQAFQLSGGPGWIDSDRYDIEAKAEGNPARKQMMMMLQTLLEERFQLRVHHETKEFPAYVLNVAKGGPKLHFSNDGNCIPPSSPEATSLDQKPANVCGNNLVSSGRRWNATNTSMPGVVAVLSAVLRRTVIDKTGITGTFDVHLEWTPDEVLAQSPTQGDPGRPVSSVDEGPSIFTALQEQLGLKLESTKAPGDALVIDHIERPSEN